MTPFPALVRLLLLAAAWVAPGLAAVTAPTLLWAQERTVVDIYSATDSAAFLPLIDAFERRRPDIRVTYREFNTAELFDHVLRRHGDPDFTADVIISSAADLQTRLVNKGLAMPVSVPGEETLPDWASWRGELWGFTYEPAALVYNRAAFADRPLPESHSDLAGMIRDDPAFFDHRIGTFDARLSGIGYMFATQDDIQGQNASRLVESLGRAHARLFCCTAPMLDGVAGGDLVMAYNVIGSYALARVREDPRVGIHFMSDYTLIMTRAAFILKSTPVPDAAADFLRFLLSADGQHLIATRSSLIPLLESARSQPEIRSLTGGQRVPPFPIKLGPGLLAYLDTLKKRNFLANWEASIHPRPPPDPGQ